MKSFNYISLNLIDEFRVIIRVLRAFLSDF